MMAYDRDGGSADVEAAGSIDRLMHSCVPTYHEH